MPNFYAPLSGHSNTAGDVFALEILGPDHNLVTAYVAPEYEHTFVARELAAQFGKQEGDEIPIELRQRNPETFQIHTFDPICITVRYSHPRLGRNYIHLGIEDLSEFFALTLYEPKDADAPEPPFLFLETLPENLGCCHVLPD